MVAHQGAKLAAKLASRLLAALVEPSPEDYRQILRRLAALEGEKQTAGLTRVSVQWPPSGLSSC